MGTAKKINGIWQEVFETSPDHSKKRKIKFFHNGILKEAQAVPSSDCFFEIIGGRYNGNLIHTFDIIENADRKRTRTVVASV